MKLAGFFLLPAGWLIAISAVVLFPQTASRAIFVFAGVSMEGIGLGLCFRAARVARESSE
ncbi:MAG TPA: hypothetical protein VND66_06865 [Acidobacteriaceae bacterium]|nr:hypothetical protein [Terriglobia bacterium]HVC90326.1 hypothetical protein [Acidobacteriaceae bacterium]